MKPNVEIVKNQNAVRELDYTGLFVHVLYKWKQILIISVLAAVCSCLWTYIKQDRAENNNTGEQTSASLSSDFYDTLVDSFDRKIDEEFKYLDNTFLKDMDENSLKTVVMTYYVQWPSDVQPGTEAETELMMRNASFLSHSIEDRVNYGIDWNTFETPYSFKSSEAMNELTTAEMDGRFIEVHVSFIDEESCNALADFVDESIRRNFADLVTQNSLNGYSLVQTDRLFSELPGESITNFLSERTTRIVNLQNAKEQFIKAYDKMGYSAVEKQSTGLKTYIKKGLFGFAAGLIVSVICLLAWLLVNDTVLSDKEVENTFGTEKIIELPVNSKNGNRTINRMFNHRTQYKGTSEDDLYKMARHFITNTTGKKKVAVISDLPQNVIHTMVSRLSDSDIETIDASSIVTDVEQRNRLLECDGAILVVEEDKSKYRNLIPMIQLINKYGIELIGYIIR